MLNVLTCCVHFFWLLSFISTVKGRDENEITYCASWKGRARSQVLVIPCPGGAREFTQCTQCAARRRVADRSSHGGTRSKVLDVDALPGAAQPAGEAGDSFSFWHLVSGRCIDTLADWIFEPAARPSDAAEQCARGTGAGDFLRSESIRHGRTVHSLPAASGRHREVGLAESLQNVKILSPVTPIPAIHTLQSITKLNP